MQIVLPPFFHWSDDWWWWWWWWYKDRLCKHYCYWLESYLAATCGAFAPSGKDFLPSSEKWLEDSLSCKGQWLRWHIFQGYLCSGAEQRECGGWPFSPTQVTSAQTSLFTSSPLGLQRLSRLEWQLSPPSPQDCFFPSPFTSDNF